MPLLVKDVTEAVMTHHNGEPLSHTHEHSDGFDIVLPDLKALKGDLLLWAMVAIAAGYLGYLIYSIVQDRKTKATVLVVPVTTPDKPSDESQGL